MALLALPVYGRVIRHCVRVSRIGALMALLVVLSSADVSASAATIQAIELPDGTGLGARALNNNGVVAAEGNGGRSFRWHAGAVTDLNGGLSTQVFDINDAGAVAGTMLTGSDLRRNKEAVVWAPGASDPTVLSRLDPEWGGQAMALDHAGNPVGWSYRLESGILRTRPVRWPGPESLLNETPDSEARDVNVLGSVAITGSRLWRNGQITDLQCLSGGDLNDSDVVVGSMRDSLQPALWRNGTCTPLPTLAGWTQPNAQAINNAGTAVGAHGVGSDRRAVAWSPEGEIIHLNDLLPEGSGWTLEYAIDINERGQVMGMGRRPDGQSRYFLLTPDMPALAVTLLSADVPNSDLVHVQVTVKNEGTAAVEELAAGGGTGLTAVPGLFSGAGAGQIAVLRDSGQAFPGTLAAGASASRVFTFMSTKTGKVLLQSQFTGKSGAAEVRDAEYAEISIEANPGPAGALEQMAGIEAFATGAHNVLLDASREFAKKRVKQMQALGKGVRKRWLGSANGKPKIRMIDRAMAHMHGMSPEEYVTQVPRGDVVRKGGAARIAAARRAVAGADSPRAEARAHAELGRVVRKQTLTSSESMAAYNRARMLTDNNELWKIYDEYGEKPAKELWKNGGGALRGLLQLRSYEGRQQIEADLVRFAILNEQSFKEGGWVWADPVKAVDDSMFVFRENVAEAETFRARRAQLKRDLYVSDPEKAIYLKAEEDSLYGAQVLRGFIELFDPTPGPVEVLTWAGKKGALKVSRGSIMAALANRQGDKLVGGKIMEGVEDLGEGVRHADDFVFSKEGVLGLDQIGRKGGAGMREQRIAEQINREVTADLAREFPNVDIEFAMSYKAKKDYDPVGALAKPQAFSEKTLDPRSIQILGAPPEGLGKLVIFHPKHPTQNAGWKNLPEVQQKADLELFNLHYDQWINFNKRNPAGKTAEWKKAIGEKRQIDFGGGHTVELELEKHRLGKNAFEIRASEMSIDGTLIHKGKAASIGGDLDPLVAVNAKTGKKLEGEIERRALELWNQKAIKAQKDFGFRSGGHGATMHGDDVTPQQWAKFAKLAGVHLSPAEQLRFEALVVKRAGLPAGTKIFPASLRTNEHLLRTTITDTYVGPLGQIFD